MGRPQQRSNGRAPADKIWPYCRGKLKVFSLDRSAIHEIASWSGCSRHCRYFYPGGTIAEDAIIPESMLSRAMARIGGHVWKGAFSRGLLFRHLQGNPVCDINHVQNSSRLRNDLCASWFAGGAVGRCGGQVPPIARPASRRGGPGRLAGPGKPRGHPPAGLLAPLSVTAAETRFPPSGPAFTKVERSKILNNQPRCE